LGMRPGHLGAMREVGGADFAPVRLWNDSMVEEVKDALQAVAGDRCGITKACWIPLPLDTAVTLRWSSAGGAHTYQSVDLDVVTLSE